MRLLCDELLLCSEISGLHNQQKEQRIKSSRLEPDVDEFMKKRTTHLTLSLLEKWYLEKIQVCPTCFVYLHLTSDFL